MEVQDPFTLTFSNESNIFTSSNMYSFRTNINPPFVLPIHKWEVAATKVIFPRASKIMVPSSEIEINIFPRHERTLSYLPFITKRIYIKATYIDSLDSLIAMVQESILMQLKEIYREKPKLFNIVGDQLPGIQFSLEKYHNRLRFNEVKLLGLPNSLQNSTLRIVDGLFLWHMLGFQNVKSDENLYNLPMKAEYLPSLTHGLSSLALIAPNLVEEHYVGDRSLPLLEVLPYPINSPTQYTIFEQRYPLYKPIHGGYINYVAIELVDLDNNPIQFESGKLQIVLHFRPCRSMIKW